MKIRIISEADARAIVTPAVALAEVRSAFATLARGGATLPASLEMEMPQANGELHVKGAYIHGAPFFSVKAATGFYGNADVGLPVASGVVLVFDIGTGLLDTVIFDNGFLTEIRTGAAGALAADLFARADASVAAVIGSGGQARYQIEALAGVRHLAKVVVWARHRKAADEYASEMQERTGIPFRVADTAHDAIRNADIIVTATPSRAPVMETAWIRSGTHITAMGADLPEKCELPATLAAKVNKFVVDSRPQALRSGELHHAVESGGFREEDVYAELGEVEAGQKPGRESDDEITVVDLTGLGIQDAAMANVVAARGRTLDLGSILEI